jgi:hypothetical protein
MQRDAVIGEGVIDRAPTGKRDLPVMQSAFKHWSAESGRDLTSDPLRLEYEARVMALRGRVDAMRQHGLPVEAIARALHAERTRLCKAFKERTPEPQRTRIAQRTCAVYGDPFGPSVEYLRAKGKSWDEIIESASRPGRPPADIREA